MRVIVQTDGLSPIHIQSRLHSLQVTASVQRLRQLDGRGTYVVSLSPSQIMALAQDDGIRHISPDRIIHACSDYTAAAVGADVVQNVDGLTGNGVVVAVIDSGIASHPDLSGTSRIVGWTDLVNGLPTPYDDFGHGTHVAGIIGGNGGISLAAGFNPGLTKIAPGVQFVGVKVLDQSGQGNASNVIAGINWCIANQSTYHIRIINLSLGMGIGESYTTDPLCQACEQAWQAGILVVVAAGNNGRSVPSDPNSSPVYGTINSPGNDPTVLTVGAMNTKGTATRSSSVIASYSSRGPSAIDMVAKPDILAPGNQTDSLIAAGSTLATTYPGNVVLPTTYGATSGANTYFTLSGTSMATPVVAGAAALLLEADPTLTPDTLKARLMLSADSMGNTDPFSYGQGYLNIPAALASTVTVTQPALTPTVTQNTNGTLTFNNVVWGNNWIWGSNLIWGNNWIWGSNLIWGNNWIWGSDFIWGNSFIEGTNWIWGSSVDPAEADAIVTGGDPE